MNQASEESRQPAVLCVACQQREAVRQCGYVLGWEPDNHVLGQLAHTCDAPLCLVCTRSLTVGIATAAAGIGYRGLTRDYCPVHAEQITSRPADVSRDVLDETAAAAARWWITEGKSCYEQAHPATAPE